MLSTLTANASPVELLAHARAARNAGDMETALRYLWASQHAGIAYPQIERLEDGRMMTTVVYQTGHTAGNSPR